MKHSHPIEALSGARGFLWKTIRRGGITFLLDQLRGSKRAKSCMTYFLRFKRVEMEEEKKKETVGLIMTDVHPGIARNSRSKNNTSIAIGRFGNLRKKYIWNAHKFKLKYLEDESYSVEIYLNILFLYICISFLNFWLLL